MSESATEPRDSYSPSGKINWLLFLPGLAVTTGVAMLMAFCLLLAYEFGFYLLFIAPAIAALITGSVWMLVLKWSRCRSPLLAIMTSVPLALVAYLGYYHLGIVRFVGVRNAHRVDLLPRYILFRMQTDIARDVGDRRAANPLKGPDAVQQAFNWFFLVGEAACVIGIIVGIGHHRATRVYCESCGRWTKSETTTLAAGAGTAAWEALKQGKQLEAQQHLAHNTPIQMGCGATIEHCTECRDRPETSRVYFSVTDVRMPPVSDTQKAPKIKPKVYKLVKQVVLQPAEVVAVAGAFSSLKSTIEAQPQVFDEAKSKLHELELKAGPQLSEWRHSLAQIETLDGPKTILTTKNIAIQTLIAVVTAFGGFALGFAPGGILLATMNNPPEWMLGIAVGWLAVWLILSLVWNLYFPNYWTARFMRWRTWKSFSARPNSAVDFLNPDIYFVDIIPRAHWGKPMVENATDIGFVEINREHGELIFEGDCQRYWIPVSSILEIKHEFFADPAPQAHGKPPLHHLIVVRAMTANGPWETWFYRRHQGFRTRTEKCKLADSLELESKIRELIQETQGGLSAN